MKDKEKTKLMRKLTKTNCPEALDDILVPVVDDKDSDDDDVRDDDSCNDDSRDDDDDEVDDRTRYCRPQWTRRLWPRLLVLLLLLELLVGSFFCRYSHFLFTVIQLA